MAQAVWLHLRFPSSLCAKEAMPLKREVEVSYESLRHGMAGSAR